LDKVIGLGKLGCAIAEELTAYPEYRIYKIDAEIDERGSFSIGASADMEAYEKNFDSTAAEVYLRSIKPGDSILVIMSGGDPVSGCILRLLECIKDAEINVLYIVPEREMISGVQKRDDKISFNVLQEYARSGVFKSLLLVKKTVVEKLMGDVSIQQYEKNISYFISYTIAMINYFEHTEPIVANKIAPVEWCRIGTYGISSLDEKNQDTNLLFPLEAISDIHFFYGVPSQELDQDPTLMKKIKEHVKSFKSGNISTSFSVYSTSFDNLMVLCSATSARIQPLSTEE
tara:strand:- start:715 stop:1575 length:861 start_codon:yes stop_codon:yes gene_type:complete